MGEAYRRLLSGIREVASDKRVMITSNMEGLQNLTVGALEAFLPIYAVKVAGLNEFQAGLLWGAQVLVTIVSKLYNGECFGQLWAKATHHGWHVTLRGVLWGDPAPPQLLPPDARRHRLRLRRSVRYLVLSCPGGGHLQGETLRHGHGNLRHNL